MLGEITEIIKKAQIKLLYMKNTRSEVKTHWVGLIHVRHCKKKKKKKSKLEKPTIEVIQNETKKMTEQSI